MKLFATIIAIATASTAISYDTKIGCTCCLGSISCCAACCISHCTADADVQAKVTESLKVIQVGPIYVLSLTDFQNRDFKTEI